MGTETNCKARFDQRVSAGHAMLETDYVLFRGDFRVKIPFQAMRQVRADGAWLKIEAPEGILELDLGAAAAAKWEQKILHPPSRLDKLGVKAGHKVAILGVSDKAFVGEVAGGGGGGCERGGGGSPKRVFRVGEKKRHPYPGPRPAAA